jgi:hypothetical protein
MSSLSSMSRAPEALWKGRVTIDPLSDTPIEVACPCGHQAPLDRAGGGFRQRRHPRAGVMHLGCPRCGRTMVADLMEAAAAPLPRSA